MRVFLLCTITIALFTLYPAFAQGGTNLERVEFIQYVDENTALEEIRAENLHTYYFQIPSERLKEQSDREGLQVFESSGGSYSILLNPAESETFNPFSLREVRHALNYVVDRNLIVNELMGGYGTPLISKYGPSDADYLVILDKIQSIKFQHNLKLAASMIDDAMVNAGAHMRDGVWIFDDEPVQVRIFIRSDDPVRKSIGETLSVDLTKLGFVVHRDYGDLNKAFVTVYGSDPAKLEWSVYTEGWAAPRALVKYDQIGLAQMYSPWFSNMPGFNIPGYWNYENEKLDEITQTIYAGRFESSKERESLMHEAIEEGIRESVRIFIAEKKDLFVASSTVDGLVNDFGAGLTNRFSTIDAKTESGILRIGVKQIYQGSWNPVMGFTDYYSSYIWGVLSDPGSFRHPHTGEILPLRVHWNVESAGLASNLSVPSDAQKWDEATQQWISVGSNVNATSKVVFDYVFGSWHHGATVDMADVLYSAYFAYEWGTDIGSSDVHKDPEYTARVGPYIQTIKGIKVLDADTLEVYVDYWHFDESEIAAWATIWPAFPWEINAAMEKLVSENHFSFSKSDATSRSLGWLSVIIPNDAHMIRESLIDFTDLDFIHPSLAGYADLEYHKNRYAASEQWIADNDHALISNGPYLFESYEPESRTIRIASYKDAYPFNAQSSSRFVQNTEPAITNVQWPHLIVRGESAQITIHTENTDNVHYYITDAHSTLVHSGVVPVSSGIALIHVDENLTNSLAIGSASAALFASSESVLRTYSYVANFLVSDISSSIQSEIPEQLVYAESKNESIWIALASIFVIVLIVYAYRNKWRKIRSVD